MPYTTPPSIIERIERRRGQTVPALDPATTALVIVDMQNYFVREDYAPRSHAARGIVDEINKVAEAVRGSGGMVVWIQTTAEGALLHWWRHHAEGLNARARGLRLEGLSEDSSGFSLYEGLDHRQEDIYVKKIKFSAFAEESSRLDAILKERGIETTAICGTLTNVCCDSTARDAMMKNYRSIMISNANAALTESEHGASLDTFQAFFGYVMNGDEFIAHLDAGAV
ncbi:Peroxyureidoacrylate/ureidoacrylate amidohydrolase RutB [Pigmentiphaga humi]|uniref:Peroxyureidoacrylate/ureidoacrylate amidohydrolase RutB n=1 Tax=Pigmentiphaga humi TaxID=2478468 RepID=A0A3P4B856_9BURK|nr:cysteine hydrolase [Pigmentiphaga humi]VCU71868.1 Peroxyureidoacrylate/ureidoacrylate amidohydrolase RutB [Pigmentiphaga humi]